MHIPTPPTLFPLSSFTFYNVPYICWLPPGTHPVKPSLLAALANLASPLHVPGAAASIAIGMGSQLGSGVEGLDVNRGNAN